jgi:CRISPR-associated endoribonuclease Cas6
MRVKLSFLRTQGSNNTVPLHHQKLVSSFVESVMDELGYKPDFYNFSSLKGTSKVQNGFMRFLSSKVSLVASSNNNEFVDAFVHKIFEKQTVQIGKLSLIPKAYQFIEYPSFTTKMRYVCISPLVVADPDIDPELSQTIIDPFSHEFSDFIYNAITEKMERAGFSDDELNEFAEFEVVPDRNYISKINESGKKFARQYKNNQDKPMIGYLIPFTLHAHPKVHKFIWDCGLGMLNTHGYGMIDIVKEEGSENLF